ncbi:MAG TPA: glycosyltransferase [Nocardioides sp.]|nr:glycosyltransferase [Nocardioides sp.]
MDVVFAAIPAYGHLYPLMPLAEATAAAGHRVTVATGSPFCGALSLPTTRVLEEHVGLSWVEAEARRRHPEAEGRDIGIAIFADITANLTASGLLEAWEQRRPDLVVLESGNVGAAVAAHVVGVPAVAVAVGVWGPFGTASYDAVLGFAADHWHRHGVAPPASGTDLLAGFVDPLPPALGLGAPATVPHVPLRPVGYSHGDAPLPGWLEEPPRRRRVLLTLGTVAYGAVEAMRTALDGLLALDLEVLVVVGPDGDPAALGAVPPHVHLERFVPQERVLPLLDLVVHHGGTGNLLGALRHGLPALVLPQGADQFVNAARLAEVGAGRALEGDALTADAVAGAVAAMLPDDSAERRRARELESEIATMPAPSEVVAVLEQLAAR